MEMTEKLVNAVMDVGNCNCEDVEVKVNVNMYYWSFLDDIATKKNTTVEKLCEKAISDYVMKLFTEELME